MATGEVVAAYGWNASLVNLKKQGLDVAMMVPKERMFTWIAGFTMHKNVKNEDAAYDLIDAWSSPESGAWLMENYGYGSTNLKAYEKADPEKLAQLGISDPVAVLNNSLFFKSLAPEFEKKYQALFADVSVRRLSRQGLLGCLRLGAGPRDRSAKCGRPDRLVHEPDVRCKGALLQRTVPVRRQQQGGNLASKLVPELSNKG